MSPLGFWTTSHVNVWFYSTYNYDNIFVYIPHSDPFTRYLQTAQDVPVNGVQHCRRISSVVTMADRMYVTEEVREDAEVFSMGRAFVYDVDYSKVRHRERSETCLTCSNRQPLIIVGFNGSIKRILPCLITNTLYVLEDPMDDWLHSIVHRITSDGDVLLRWELELPA